MPINMVLFYLQQTVS